jgi:uncharacterized phage protein (TIGR01671 family)
MREIRYQAWLGHTMIQVTKMDFMKNASGEYENNGQGYFLDGENKGEHTGFRMSEVQFRQYTGLKDKNGKEIYEGDILDTHAQYDDIYIRRVVYERCGLTLEPGTGYTLTKSNERHFEVIGNIYENPELIN